MEEPAPEDAMGGFGYADLASWTERLAGEREEVPAEEEEEMTSRLPFSSWDWSTVHFPDCSGSRSLELPRPDSSLLPPGVSLTEPSYTVSRGCLRLNVQPVAYEDHLDYSHGSAGSKAVLAARNWGEYKSRYAELATGAWRELAPTAHLWKDDVTPLVSPEEAFSSGICYFNTLRPEQNDLTLYVLNFSEEILTCFYILCHSPTLTCQR